MLTRKQQWRRMKKVRRQQQQPRSIIDLDLLATSKKKRQLEGKPPQQPHQHAPCFGEDVEGEEDTGSSSSSSSCSFSCAWSSSDSLHDDGGSSGSSSSSDDGDDDVDDCRAPATAPLPLDPTATSPNNLVDPSSSSAAGAAVAYGEVGPARPKGVSFQQEVQVFLVTHKSELDHSAKRALWWTGRDAAINKRAWLNHLGQPGCGRQSAVRPRQEPKHQQEDGGASDFLGAGRDTAAGRGRGIWSAHHGSNDSDGYGGGAVMTGVGAGEEEGPDAAQLLPSSSPPPVSVGILGCRCDACLTEGDDHDQHQHQQPRSDRSTPPYNYHPPPPPPPHQRPVFDYNYNYRPPPSPVPSRSRYSGRPASKTWPSPADWARGDGDDADGMGFSLGGRSRSYSPASARQGTSPLREACDSYDDDDDVFPRGSNFFDDDDGGDGDFE